MDAGTRTVTAAVTVEIDRVRGSRFVARLAPANSELAARALLYMARAVDVDATHHCWAWRAPDGRERSDGGGEPRGTAGAPILRHLTGADLVGVALVVTRWFGGTKLGRGGLVRAYGAAAAAAIAAANVVVHVPMTVLRVSHRYADAGSVDAVLHGQGTEAVASDYGATVTRVVRRDRPGRRAAPRADRRDLGPRDRRTDRRELPALTPAPAIGSLRRRLLTRDASRNRPLLQEWEARPEGFEPPTF